MGKGKSMTPALEFIQLCKEAPFFSKQF